MIVFLDFDGVTHAFFPRKDLTDEENQLFYFLPRIEKVLREFEEVKVVISSSWRLLAYSLDDLRSNFSEDMRERVIGVTPEIKLNTHVDWEGRRQREVELYLSQNQLEGTPWLALDDVKENYLPDANLLLCKDKFDEVDAQQLREMLTKLRTQFSDKNI